MSPQQQLDQKAIAIYGKPFDSLDSYQKINVLDRAKANLEQQAMNSLNKSLRNKR